MNEGNGFSLKGFESDLDDINDLLISLFTSEKIFIYLLFILELRLNPKKKKDEFFLILGTLRHLKETRKGRQGAGKGLEKRAI